MMECLREKKFSQTLTQHVVSLSGTQLEAACASPLYAQRSDRESSLLTCIASVAMSVSSLCQTVLI